MKNLGYYGRRNVCGERVRMARLAKRISQETLAAKMQTKGVNIAQDAISNIESGARLVMDYELRAFASVLKYPLKTYWTRKKNDPTEEPWDFSY